MFPPLTWDFSAAYSINPLANKTLKRQLEDEDCNQAAVAGGSFWLYFVFGGESYLGVEISLALDDLGVDSLRKLPKLNSNSHQKTLQMTPPLPVLFW